MSGEIDQLKANTQQAQEDEQVSVSDKVKNIYNFSIFSCNKWTKNTHQLMNAGFKVKKRRDMQS